MTQFRTSRLQMLVLVCLVLGQSGAALAQEVDPGSLDALAKTQQMLQGPAVRNKVIGNSPGAQTVDAQVKALAGSPEATEALFKISGAVLEDLVNETGGDPAKIMQIMNQAQTDPKSLFSHLSEKNKELIHDTASKIESSPTTRQPASSTTGK